MLRASRFAVAICLLATFVAKAQDPPADPKEPKPNAQKVIRGLLAKLDVAQSRFELQRKEIDAALGELQIVQNEIAATIEIAGLEQDARRKVLAELAAKERELNDNRQIPSTQLTAARWLRDELKKIDLLIDEKTEMTRQRAEHYAQLELRLNTLEQTPAAIARKKDVLETVEAAVGRLRIRTKESKLTFDASRKKVDELSGELLLFGIKLKNHTERIPGIAEDLELEHVFLAKAESLMKQAARGEPVAILGKKADRAAIEQYALEARLRCDQLRDELQSISVAGPKLHAESQSIKLKLTLAKGQLREHIEAFENADRKRQQAEEFWRRLQFVPPEAFLSDYDGLAKAARDLEADPDGASPKSK